LATLIAFNCVIAALRLLHWHFGVKHAERERRRRLEIHRKTELSTLGTRRYDAATNRSGSCAEGKASICRSSPS
jgi:hypothetical protein